MTNLSLTSTLHRAIAFLIPKRLQVCSTQQKADDMPVTPVFSSAAARAEGWDVFECETREDGSVHAEIQRLVGIDGSASRFEDDDAAWEHVVARARAGSPLHRAALTIVDPVERALIRFWCSAEDLLP